MDICHFVRTNGQMDKCAFVPTNGQMSFCPNKWTFVHLLGQWTNGHMSFVHLSTCPDKWTNGQIYKFCSRFAVFHHLSLVRICPNKFCHFVPFVLTNFVRPPPQEHFVEQKDKFCSAILSICPNKLNKLTNFVPGNSICPNKFCLLAWTNFVGTNFDGGGRH